MEKMNYENILGIIAMTVRLSVVSERDGKLYKYSDISEAEDADEYEGMKDRAVIWISTEGGELALTLS